MSGMKDRLYSELSTVKISKERKQQMLHAIKKPEQKSLKSGKWQYRTVLVSFVILALSFTYISFVSTGTGNLAVNSADVSGESTFSIMTLLQSEFVKLASMLALFMIVYLILMRNIRKEKRTFPVCTNCGEEWTRKQSFFGSIKNRRTCYYCGATQYLTRKTNKNMLWFQFSFTFILIIAQIFSGSFVGIVVYLILFIILYILVAPYYMVLQSENPDKEPFW
ncbi:TIGR04104 family putative zinc finger protein [Sporosarcina sp.]|nr:TIGR04104 family putative zinc finger protein [Sporosarcina sp.]